LTRVTASRRRASSSRPDPMVFISGGYNQSGPRGKNPPT